MASIFGFFHRNWQSSSPPTPPKHDNALKLGIMGAANIGPSGIFHPAKSHPEVIIQAVAARDRSKAEGYAKKHEIPHVFDSYDALLNDPSIDAVYIPLPAGLHCEWALKVISKGKHVIIEKPATVNAAQSERLFRSPVLQQPNAPVLLEAIHFSFQPTWQYFLTLVDTPKIDKADAIAKLPFYIIPRGGIRFDLKLGGGSLLELGTYPLYALRKIMSDEPEECVACKTRNPPPPHELCDKAADAVFRFPGGRIGNAVTDVRAPITTLPTFQISVLHKEIKIEQPDVPSNQTKRRRRKLILHNFLISSFWHSIDIEDEYTIRDNTEGKILKKWTEKKSKKSTHSKTPTRINPGNRSGILIVINWNSLSIVSGGGKGQGSGSTMKIALLRQG